MTQYFVPTLRVRGMVVETRCSEQVHSIALVRDRTALPDLKVLLIRLVNQRPVQ